MFSKCSYLIAILMSGTSFLSAQVTQAGAGYTVSSGNINQSDIVFPVSGVVLDLEVEVAITLTTDRAVKQSGALDISLTGPDNVARGPGTTSSVILFTHLSSAALYMIFDDNAAQTCSSLCSSGCGSPGSPERCQPDFPMSPFIDETSNTASWQLTLDNTAGIHDAELLAWSLTLDGDPPLPLELSAFSVD